MELEKLRAFVRSPRVGRYLDLPNVTSVGIGYKVEKGEQTEAIVIQFTVERKVGLEELEGIGSRAIPDSFSVDGERVDTDVLERRYARSFDIVAEEGQPFRKSRREPVVPGISVAHVDGKAGSLGCFVYDSHSGTPYVLSNWHVLHGTDGGVGDDIVQPGPFDDNSGVASNALGKLVRSHLGLAGDCAVSTVERAFDPAIHDLDVVPERIAKAELGDKLIKSGRTTGVTHGIVTRIEVTNSIFYGSTTGAHKIGGFEISPDPAHPAANHTISMAGDSGSAWLAKNEATGAATNIVVGLHTSDSSATEEGHAFASNIRSVLRKLNVTLKRSGDSG